MEKMMTNEELKKKINYRSSGSCCYNCKYSYYDADWYSFLCAHDKVGKDFPVGDSDICDLFEKDV